MDLICGTGNFVESSNKKIFEYLDLKKETFRPWSHSYWTRSEWIIASWVKMKIFILPMPKVCKIFQINSKELNHLKF